jgi:curved DNA-binding protein CbpA
VNRQLDLVRAGLSAEEYFVLTRVDGRTSLRQLLDISGFPEGQTLTILRHLRQLGAIYLPGEDPTRPPAPVLPEATPLPTAAIDERLLAEEVELSLEQKRLILGKQASLARATHFGVLEVAADADKKTLKAAYRKLSKEFHPDRYFGKRLGSYQARLAEIFEMASLALEVLSDERRRDEYLAALRAGRVNTPPYGTSLPAAGAEMTPNPGPAPSAQAGAAAPPRRPTLTGAELFEEACHHEVTGDLKRALGEFARAVEKDPQPRFLRRAAEACLRAQELRDAEEYAKRGAELDPQNAAAHRVLGRVYRAQGRLDDARRALEQAVRLDPGNSFIAAEAAELRALAGAAGS